MKRSARLRAPTVGNGSYSPLPAAWASTGAARTAHIRTLASPTPNRVIAARTIQTRPLALAGGALVAVEALIAPLRAGRDEALVAAGLLVAVAAGIVLEGRVLKGSPVPGNDWAKYVLYGDEIRRHGSLLIRNPFWMLGVPFREDPGAPALYGSYLAMTGQPASVLMHGIWVLSAMSILSVFAFVRGLWGAAAGVVAAALWAAVPINQDILGWHGLANEEALVLMPLALLYGVALAREGIGVSGSLGFAAVMVGLAAAHRLSLIVGG